MVLPLLLAAGCITSNGRVNVAATTGVWGAALVVGGAAVAVGGTCDSSDEYSDEPCDPVEGEPIAGGGIMIAGAGLLALAWLFHHSED